MSSRNEERVIEILKKYKMGLTINEIAKVAQLTRQTIAVIVAGLIGSNKVYARKVGPARMIYWRSNS